MKEIDEKMMKEIEIGAKHMGISPEEAEAEYRSICEENKTDVNDNVSQSLFRNYVRGNMKPKKMNNNSGSNSLVKKHLEI